MSSKLLLVIHPVENKGALVSLMCPDAEAGKTPALVAIEPVLQFVEAMKITTIQITAERLLAKDITNPTVEQTKEEMLRLTITEVKEYMESQARKAALNNNQPGPRP